MSQISIFLEHPLYPFILPFHRNILRSILEGMHNGLCNLAGSDDSPHIDIFFVTDAKIRFLNREHMGRNSPTNILTFPFANNLPGAMALSLDTFERECLLYGQNAKTHLLFLLSHGFAHLDGTDHESPLFQIHALEYENIGLKIMRECLQYETSGKLPSY